MGLPGIVFHGDMFHHYTLQQGDIGIQVTHVNLVENLHPAL